jgi:pre-rRNA-processing protein TSR4
MHCFDFVQIMPQLLNELSQDEMSEQALDWGTIAVYSCPVSCQQGVKAALTGEMGSVPGSAYVEEYVWVQPPL